MIKAISYLFVVVVVFYDGQIYTNVQPQTVTYPELRLKCHICDSIKHVQERNDKRCPLDPIEWGQTLQTAVISNL